ncbi:MAG: double-strand break repair protein AddB [Alphaproteobacteria bacterium]
MNCYTISPLQPFFPTLAGWVLKTYANRPQELVSLRILLPGRRACRSLQEAFLQQSGGTPLMLPRIEPLGEVSLPGYVAELPVISPLRRQLLLMRLISQFKGKRQAKPSNMEKSAELAAELARFMDEVAREGLDYSGLENLVPEELSEHWNETIEFLHIISEQWPNLLRAEQVTDPVQHRNDVLLLLAEEWQRNEPKHPVIAAGSTGSQPATARLLTVIAKLPQGRVILPGLDVHMPEQEWELIGDTHPQYLLKQLIEQIGCKRQDVHMLQQAVGDSAQTQSLRQLFAPASITGQWKQTDMPLKEGLSHIRIIEAENELEEARRIGILLREALETPGKTAALITPDRILAQLVATQMERYAVAIDDSAGQNLMDSPAAVFLRLVVAMVCSGAAPVPLLALLRHPLAAGGLQPAQCRALSRQMEILLLRGVRMQSGLEALCKAAAAHHSELSNFLRRMDEYMQPLSALFEARESVPLATLIRAHVGFAQWLATTPDAPGSEYLWAKESGNHLARWLAELLDHADALQQVDPFIYPATFEALLSTQTYWPKRAGHPRLHILSPIEARLQRYDRVILGGLNEGTWPASTSTDPWMSRPMRQQFGLPLPERSVGQGAHDVYMASFAPEVFFTRANKVAGMPHIASRWLVRLDTLAEGKGPALHATLHDTARYDAAAAFIGKPVAIAPLDPPSPQPPAEARPERMKVTDIDKWLADPYVIYARYILKLKKLDALDSEPAAADFGNLVHDALQAFTTKWPQQLPVNALQELLQCGHEVFREWLARPAVHTLWLPRFEALAGWLIEQELLRRNNTLQVLPEVQGSWQLEVQGKPFTLVTRIDRIEHRKDGSLAIIDYKTGSVPKEKDVKSGKKNQLPLEALVVERGVLQNATALPKHATAFEYWKLGNRAEASEINTIRLTAHDITATRNMLEELIRNYDRPGATYAAQQDVSNQLDYNDYEHLTRRLEWEAV